MCEWVSDFFDEGRLWWEGFFDVVLIVKKWKEYLSGDCNWVYYFWDVLMFEVWFDSVLC